MPDAPWLRWLIPALVLATVVAATFNLEPAFADDWISPHYSR